MIQAVVPAYQKHFTEGDIDISGLVAGTDPITGQPVRATFVANGQIHLTGNSDLTAYDPLVGGPNDPGVVIFSNYLEPPAGPTCTGNAVQFSVSAADWTGIIFAPHGQAKLSFSSSSTLNGGIFAYTVDVSGSSFELSWQNNPTATPDFEAPSSGGDWLPEELVLPTPDLTPAPTLSASPTPTASASTGKGQ